MCRLALLILLLLLLWAPAVVLGEGGLLSRVRAAGAVRVCADPNNLPFSSDDPAEPGFDVELAEGIARLLGVRAEIRWEPTFLGQRAIRQLVEGRCDLFMGLPHDPRFLDGNRRLALSTPYYTLRHVLISPSGRPAADLNGVRTGKVAVERGAMADVHLFKEGYNRYVYRTQTDAFKGFVRGEADFALLWEPVARWLMKGHTGPPFQVVLVSGPDLEFKMAVGMRRGDPDFHSAVDEVVKRLLTEGEVEKVLGRYGMPPRPRPSSAPGCPAPIMLAQSGPIPTDPTLKVGRSFYYQMCAPCHGPDASGGGPVGPLKHFRGSAEDFVRATLEGRIAKGMPPFQGRVSEAEVNAIRVFVLGLAK